MNPFWQTPWIVRQLAPALTLALASISASAAPPTAPAATGQSATHFSRWAAGAMLGDPSGLSAKSWLDGERAIDFGLAYALDSYLTFNADYLVHSASLATTLRTQEPAFRKMRAYAGIGGAIYFSTNNSGSRTGFRQNGNSMGVAVRVPLGIEWMLSPVGIFAELIPGVGLLPSTFGMFGGTVGVRYYFR